MQPLPQPPPLPPLIEEEVQTSDPIIILEMPEAVALLDPEGLSAVRFIRETTDEKDPRKKNGRQ